MAEENSPRFLFKDTHLEAFTGPLCDLSDLTTLVAAGQRFGTIYIDPPWQYGNQSTRNRTTKKVIKGETTGSAEWDRDRDDHYETMTQHEILSLPIPVLGAEQSHVHLWTTSSFLQDALDLLHFWNYDYKGFYCWVKPQMGMGNYYRVSKEPMLLGVRGSMRFLVRNELDWGRFNRGGHSEKPDEVRQMIERVSPPPRLELFARHIVPGWVPWGNEIPRAVFQERLAIETCGF